MQEEQAVHVVPYRDSWAVEGLGTKYVGFPTQDKAIEFGRIQADKKQAQLVVHDPQGNIVGISSQNSDSQRQVA